MQINKWKKRKPFSFFFRNFLQTEAKEKKSLKNIFFLFLSVFYILRSFDTFSQIPNTFLWIQMLGKADVPIFDVLSSLHISLIRRYTCCFNNFHFFSSFEFEIYQSLRSINYLFLSIIFRIFRKTTYNFTTSVEKFHDFWYKMW